MSKEKIYHLLETFRRIITLPFKIIWWIINIILLPCHLFIGFLLTNWENKWDREYFCEAVRKLFTFKL